MLSVTSTVNSFSTVWAVSFTSSLVRGEFVIPQARLEMQLIPQTHIPMWRAATASIAVLMPTAFAPKPLTILTSAGLSN